MSAYKQFNTKDVILSSFNTSRQFEFTGSAITSSDVGIEYYYGENPTSSLFISQSAPSTGFVYKENSTGVYHSIKHLYYSNFLTSSTGDIVPQRIIIPGSSNNPEDNRYIGQTQSPRFDNYLQSTLTQSRYFPTSTGSIISVISIPSTLYGESILPGTFLFEYTSSTSQSFNITDDQNGNLISGSKVIGNIIYAHGLAIFTSGSTNEIVQDMQFNSRLNFSYISFSSSYQIYENQYKCNINENEFNFTLNPTTLSGSNKEGTYESFVTKSYFSPYITTVGLYNDNKELLMIGKLSFPLPISNKIDTNILINVDLT